MQPYRLRDGTREGEWQVGHDAQQSVDAFRGFGRDTHDDSASSTRSSGAHVRRVSHVFAHGGCSGAAVAQNNSLSRAIAMANEGPNGESMGSPGRAKRPSGQSDRRPTETKPPSQS
jgi:hypothetical protein